MSKTCTKVTSCSPR